MTNSHNFDAGNTSSGSNSASVIVKNNSTNVSLKLTAASGVWAVTNDNFSGYITTYSGNWAINEPGVSTTVTFMADMNNDGTFGDAFSFNAFKFSDTSYYGGTYTIKPNGSSVGQQTINISGLIEEYADVTLSAAFNNVTSVVVQFDPNALGIAVDDFDISAPVVVTGPTTTVTSASLSADNGSSATDWLTNTATQTISGTLSSALVAGESVQVSYDNGTNWSAATSSLGSVVV